ncbi:MAG: PIG-L family deacetylase [Dehalococcoidia bacterium]|nr:PIG-L family deacetylase [Dehalococcoidia bacterium]
MRVLLLSPHTDDVEIGAGGLVCRLRDEGAHTFRWLVFSRCEDSLGPGMQPDTLEREFHASADFLGIADRQVLQFSVRTMPAHRQEILEAMVRARRDFKPELVVAPCLDDVHQDHGTVAAEALRAFKSSATMLGYELPWNNVSFRSTLLVRLTEEQVRRKWHAMEHYRSQQSLGREYFSQPFVESWARMRGAQCGATYAEAFDVLRAVF